MSEEKHDKIQKRYNRIAPVYDLMEGLMEKGKMDSWRQDLWDKIDEYKPKDNGKLLEAGIGTGKNIIYYPDDIEIYAVDFSEKMLREAKEKADKYNKEVKLINMDIENLNFPDNHFDIIVTSCVFCSVPNPIKGLKELKRVSKPEGKIIMLEHMKTHKEPLGTLMDAFNWVSLYTWGANINRETMQNIKKAGLEIVEVRDLLLDIVKEIVLQPKK